MSYYSIYAYLCMHILIDLYTYIYIYTYTDMHLSCLITTFLFLKVAWNTSFPNFTKEVIIVLILK